MKYIDLHVHSHCSDGTLSPTELVHYAKEKNLAAFALTDHDTISGVDEALKAGALFQIEVIPGIEFSAEYAGREVHILGYFIDPHHTGLQNKLTDLIDGRKKRNLEILDKLTALGMPLTLDDLMEGSSPDTVFTRAHFAAALLNKGYISTREQAFTKYISPGKPAYVPRKRFLAKECIDVIHEAGGIAVLAHPKLYGFSNNEITQYLKDLTHQGLDGVECYYATHTKNDTAHLLQVCKNLGLLPTGGSDFHGGNKPNLDLGTAYGNLQVPYALLDALKVKHEKRV